MVIEESTVINAPLDIVWRNFIDLTCWAEWNTVLCDVSVEEESIRQGSSFSCSIRPFLLPLYFRPKVEEEVPLERVVWRGEKFGIAAVHEFIFKAVAGAVTVKSRETFSGVLAPLAGLAFSRQRLTELTRIFLSDLRRRAESGA